MALYDLREQIRKLISTDRSSAFPFERELLLLEFQTWIYAPRDKLMIETAVVLGATKILLTLEHELTGTSPRQHRASTLSQCLKDDRYRALYDRVLGRAGGWTSLLNAIWAPELSKRLAQRRDDAKTVCEIMDYRFRYLGHGGSERKLANVSHGKFFVWKKNEESGKTLDKRWSNFRASAVPLYVSERFEPFFPLDIRQKGFVEELSKQATNSNRIRRFFGLCAYVWDTLREPEKELRRDLRALKRAPKTEPLSVEELNRMKDYSTEYLRMSAGRYISKARGSTKTVDIG